MEDYVECVKNDPKLLQEINENLEQIKDMSLATKGEMLKTVIVKKSAFEFVANTMLQTIDRLDIDNERLNDENNILKETIGNIEAEKIIKFNSKDYIHIKQNRDRKQRILYLVKQTLEENKKALSA